MAILKKEWRVFVTEMNKTGDKTESYLKAFPKCKSRESARVSATKLLQNATVNSLLKALPAIQKAAREKAVEELKDEIKFDALSVSEKREVLKKIALGELPIEDHFIKKDGTVSKYNRKPNAIERIRAIEIDNRMAGDDAPQMHKVDVVNNFTNIYKRALLLKVQYETK